MANLQAVSKAAFADKCWQRYSSYQFAAGDALAALVMQEIPRACLSLPLAFAQVEGGYLPVAVQGLQTGQNLLVAPDGRWLGGYVPAAYRSHPFTLANTPENEQVLYFDMDNDLLSNEGQAFFDETGEPAQAVREVLQFLSQVGTNRQQTAKVCEVLAQQALIQPWPIELQAGEGKRQLEGLFRVDETALNALPTEGFEALRQAGALPLVYCQLISMQHLAKLGELAQAHSTHGAGLAQSADGDLDLEFLNNGGTIKFH